MELLPPKYTAIVEFLNKHPKTYTMQEIFQLVPCDEEKFNHLFYEKKYIRGWADDTFSLTGKGDTYLANYYKRVIEDYKTKKRSKRAFQVSICTAIGTSTFL
jgi:hypothetical protein